MLLRSALLWLETHCLGSSDPQVPIYPTALLCKGSSTTEVAPALRGNPRNLQMHRLCLGAMGLWVSSRLLHPPLSCCRPRSLTAPKDSLAFLHPVRFGQWQKLARHGGQEYKRMGYLFTQLSWPGPRTDDSVFLDPRLWFLSGPFLQWSVLLGGQPLPDPCSWRPMRVVQSLQYALLLLVRVSEPCPLPCKQLLHKTFFHTPSESATSFLPRAKQLIEATNGE